MKDFPRDGRPQFAIVGRSNVGKSSLINAIFNRRDLARVSQTPGKTQAIHFYLVNETFYIVDLPGYGYAKVPREMRAAWGELMAEYFGSARSLRLLFLLLDSRRVPSDDDFRMLEWADEGEIDTRLVLTKVDKLSNNQRVQSRRAIRKVIDADEDVFIFFSKMTREGVDLVWREIDAKLREEKQSRVREAH